MSQTLTPVRNSYGNWEVRTEHEVPGFPKYRLALLTCRRFTGALTTSATCSFEEKPGWWVHRVYTDYSDSRVIHRTVGRATKEVVIAQHQEALKDHLDNCLKSAAALYKTLTIREAGGPL